VKKVFLDYAERPSDVIVTISGTNVSLADLERLVPQKAVVDKLQMYINDEAVNYYMKLLQDRNENSHFFPSFFMNKLLGEDLSIEKYNYLNVRRYSIFPLYNEMNVFKNLMS